MWGSQDRDRGQQLGLVGFQSLRFRDLLCLVVQYGLFVYYVSIKQGVVVFGVLGVRSMEGGILVQKRLGFINSRDFLLVVYRFLQLMDEFQGFYKIFEMRLKNICLSGIVRFFGENNYYFYGFLKGLLIFLNRLQIIVFK